MGSKPAAADALKSKTDGSQPRHIRGFRISTHSHLTIWLQCAIWRWPDWPWYLSHVYYDHVPLSEGRTHGDGALTRPHTAVPRARRRFLPLRFPKRTLGSRAPTHPPLPTSYTPRHTCVDPLSHTRSDLQPYTSSPPHYINKRPPRTRSTWQKKGPLYEFLPQYVIKPHHAVVLLVVQSTGLTTVPCARNRIFCFAGPVYTPGNARGNGG